MLYSQALPAQLPLFMTTLNKLTTGSIAITYWLCHNTTVDHGCSTTLTKELFAITLTITTLSFATKMELNSMTQPSLMLLLPNMTTG